LSPYVLDEVLAWIKRTELAQSSLSISSHTFRQYCWPYLHGWKVKARIVRDLSFAHEHEDEINFRNILKKDDKHEIPIAHKNPPEYIIGFEFIEFRCYFVSNILNNFNIFLDSLTIEHCNLCRPFSLSSKWSK